MDTSKAATEGQYGLAEQRSTSVFKKFGQEQWLVAVDAHAETPRAGMNKLHSGAATHADEAVTATAALVDDVRGSVRRGRLRVRSG